MKLSDGELSNEPPTWRQRDDWALGCIAGTGRIHSAPLWVFGTIFLGIGVFAWLVIAREVAPDTRHYARILGTAFAAVGLLILGAALHLVVHRRKYGVAHLWLVDPPGYVGGSFAGCLHIGARFGPNDAFQVRLECTRTRFVPSASSDSGSETRRESLWLGELFLRTPATAGPDRLELPFRFEVPAGLPPTRDASPKVTWTVHVKVSRPGLDFQERFEVPVIAGSRPQPDRPVGFSSFGYPTASVGTGMTRRTGFADGNLRIEAERRAGPFWPGTPGIGWVGLRHWELLQQLSGSTRRFQRWAASLAVLAGFGFLFGMTQNSGAPLTFDRFISMFVRMERGLFWSVATLASPLVVGGVLRAWHRKRHLDRFGVSFLRLTDSPAELGSPLRAVLEIPRQVIPEAGFSARLLCVRMRGFSADTPGPLAQTAWASDWQSYQGKEVGRDATQVPLEFAVPPDLPESGASDGLWHWYVEAHAVMPGLNYIARFRVPVGKHLS